MRFAYADPPYLGKCRNYGHNHDTWGCFDDVATHVKLFEHLDTFDGWAYSLSSVTLRELLPLTRINTRIAAWTKPFTTFMPSVRIAYSWEPVLFFTPRVAQNEGTPFGRDHCAESAVPPSRHKLFGQKPEVFCRWITVLLGFQEGDELVDLFPGTGVMGDTLRQGVLL